MTDFGRCPIIPKLHAQAVIRLFTAAVFETDPKSWATTGKEVADYRKFALLIDLAVTGSPTDVVLSVEFSDDGTIFYKFMNGPFGDLRYESTAGDKLEAVFGEIMAPYMRLTATSTGCDGSNKFTLTVKIVLGK